MRESSGWDLKGLIASSQEDWFILKPKRVPLQVGTLSQALSDKSPSKRDPVLTEESLSEALEGKASEV